MTKEIAPGEVVGFWRDAGRKAWFKKDAAFDEVIRRRFEALHHAAARGERAVWEESPEGALALILLLDQFPRNMYRGSAHAFATDGLAQRVTGAAIKRGFDRLADETLRVFFYMPYEHSEDPADQARAVELIEALGDEEYAKFARLHADVIARFGRFPHRNACLGRSMTQAELTFLEEGGFAG